MKVSKTAYIYVTNYEVQPENDVALRAFLVATVTVT